MVTDPRGLDITYDTGYETERGDVEIEVGGATRTMGFWKTHLDKEPTTDWIGVDISGYGDDDIYIAAHAVMLVVRSS